MAPPTSAHRGLYVADFLDQLHAYLEGASRVVLRVRVQGDGLDPQDVELLR